MITFSVNTSYTNDKRRRVAKLLEEINDFNRDSLSDAFINIMTIDKTNSDKMSLNALQQVRNRNDKADSSVSKEVYLLNKEEDNNDDMGLLEIVDYDDFEKKILDEIDINYFVNRFLELREKIFFDLGFDVWRMMKLTLMGDLAVKGKIYQLFAAIGEAKFLYEFCSNYVHIIKVKEILG